MFHSTRLVALGALTSILALACGGNSGNTGETTPDPVAPTEVTRDAAMTGPEAYYPPTTFAVVNIDVARIRSSQYFTELQAFWNSYTQSQANAGTSRVEPEMELAIALFERLESAQVVFALKDDGEPELGMLVGRGDLPPEWIVAALEQLDDSPSNHPTEVTTLPNGLQMIRKGEARLIYLEDGSLILGPEGEGLGSIEARAQTPPGPPAILTDSRWNEPAAQLGVPTPMIDIRMVATSPEIAREVNDGPFRGVAEHILSIHLALDGINGVQAATLVRTDDPNAAQHIINETNSAAAELSRNPMAAMLGLSNPAQFLSATQTGNDAHISMNVPHETIMQAMTMVRGLMNFAAAGQGQAATAPAP